MRKPKKKLLRGIDYEAKKERSRYNILTSPEKARKILIKGATFAITINENNKLKVLPDCSIYIVDGKIKEVFKAGKKPIPEKEMDIIYDASKRGGIVVTPGFINAHAHPPMYMLRSSVSLDIGNIINQAKEMARLESQMIDSDFYLGATGDFTEQQKYGITTTLSHYATFDPIDKAAELTRQNVINAVSAVSNSHPENTPEMVEKILDKKDRYFSKPAISIHYVHKADKEQLMKIRERIEKHKMLFTLHAAESEEWVQMCVKKYGKRSVEVLAEMGLAKTSTIISHAVHFSEKEIKLVKKYKIGIVHLPTSNKLHKSGEFKFKNFVDAGAENRICLGTDSVVSKNSLDLLSEALQTRIMHMDKYLVSFELLFKMMTSQSAEILNLGKVGKILPGYKADLAFWKLKDRGFMPFNRNKPKSLVGNMITHGGRNIRDLMINGNFIISNRRHNFINESEILTQLQEAHINLCNRIGE